jgi:2-dehydropantoate 2-reductase
MRILVYGAGVLGSLYGARLQESGNDVTILARGQRLADIREHGIVLVDALSGRRGVTRVATSERLAAEDAYDLIVVLVRRDQVDVLLPALAANIGTPNILFMVNNPLGYDEWIRAVGRDRLLVGFAGAGGTREGHVVSCSVVPGMLQATTLGEPDGSTSPRLRHIAATFRAAGFPVALSRNMDAWQKTHVAWVSPVANAIYMAGGSNYRLAHTRDGLVLLVRAVREGFAVLRALRVPVTPARHRLWKLMPEPLLVIALSRVLNTRMAEIVATRHANAARDEMRLVAEEFKSLASRAGMRTPAMDRLAEHIDPAQPSAPEGSTELPLDMRGLWLALGALAGLFATAVVLRRILRPAQRHE